MNIHYTNSKLKDQLNQSTILSIKFGSELYNLNGKHSDTDMLHVYAQGKDNLASLINYEHTLQYKENEIDHIYVSLDQFVKSLIKGESTVYFEVLHATAFNKIAFLTDNKNMFYHYKMMDAYLGLAKRDSKLARREHTEKGSKRKKLSHCLRGVYAYDQLIQGTYQNSLKESHKEKWQLLWDIKHTNYVNNDNYLQIEEWVSDEIAKRIAEFKYIQDNYAQHYFTTQTMLTLNEQLIAYTHSQEYLQVQLDKIDSDEEYANVMLNGISY